MSLMFELNYKIVVSPAIEKADRLYKFYYDNKDKPFIMFKKGWFGRVKTYSVTNSLYNYRGCSFIGLPVGLLFAEPPPMRPSVYDFLRGWEYTWHELKESVDLQKHYLDKNKTFKVRLGRKEAEFIKLIQEFNTERLKPLPPAIREFKNNKPILIPYEITDDEE